MEINFLTCKPRDVIARSIALHPSLYAEELEGLARLHANFAAHCYDASAAQAAKGLSEDCELAARYAREQRTDRICEALGTLIPAFEAACKLQCVPRNLRADIMARESAKAEG